MKLFGFLLTHFAGACLLLMHTLLRWYGKSTSWRKPVKRYSLLAIRIAQWLLYLPAHIALVALRYPLAPLAVKYFSTDDKFGLQPWLNAFMTLDNTLAGDRGWQTEHVPPGSHPLSDANRIAWLRRNGFNTANFTWLGCAADYIWIVWQVGREDHWFHARPDGYWMLRGFLPFPDVVLFDNGRLCWTPTKRYLNVYWGWSLFGTVKDRNKFTFTARIKSVKP